MFSFVYNVYLHLMFCTLSLYKHHQVERRGEEERMKGEEERRGRGEERKRERKERKRGEEEWKRGEGGQMSGLLQRKTNQSVRLGSV